MIDPTQPVQVALLIPKSYKETASIATSLEQAAQMAIADLGDIRIDLRVFDTAGKPEQAASVARQAVQGRRKDYPWSAAGRKRQSGWRCGGRQWRERVEFSPTMPRLPAKMCLCLVRRLTIPQTAWSAMPPVRVKPKRSSYTPEPLEGELGKAALENAAQSSPLEIAAIEAFEFSQKGVIDSVARIKDSVIETKADHPVSNFKHRTGPTTVGAAASRSRDKPARSSVYRPITLGYSTSDSRITGRPKRLVCQPKQTGQRKL